MLCVSACVCESLQIDTFIYPSSPDAVCVCVCAWRCMHWRAERFDCRLGRVGVSIVFCGVAQEGRHGYGPRRWAVVVDRRS